MYIYIYIDYFNTYILNDEFINKCKGVTFEEDEPKNGKKKNKSSQPDITGITELVSKFAQEDEVAAEKYIF